VAYTAISYTPKSGKKELGTAKVEANTSVAVDERLVNFSDFRLTETNFPTLPREQVKTAIAEITSTIPKEQRVIALDRVLANMDTSTIIPKNVEGLKHDPPTIFYSATPAVLVNIDGQPIWSPIPMNDLRSAVNTNWDLFEHGPTKTLYLRNGGVWLKATDVNGPWEYAGRLPDSFKKLPDDENWKDVKQNLSNPKPGSMPKVFVSLQPAELILLTGGKPNYLLVAGTKELLWVSNTEADVFRVGPNGLVYFLVAGRWFSAPDFTGPWTFATPTLPAEFKQIPLEHERSRVLASVPGTSQAAEAVLLAQIPQTARVSKTLQAPEVDYQGDKGPEFAPIETTKVQRAVNTDKDVLKVGDLYYMCFQGVWFMSKAATGPWNVAAEVPKEIYEIPVSSPAHAVTYVTVEDSDDDEVAFATMAAYTGVMIGFGCAMWGTGYYYPPYAFYGGYYPYYRPYYPTYGFGASYNPWTGAYTRGAVAYGPYGGAGVAQRYNPRTGTYSRGAAAWGPYGARGAASAYNPRTGAYGATRQGSNVYGSWGRTGVVRGDDWATTSRYTNRITGNTTRTVRTSDGDVYAGRDGNVYRKSGDGYQKYGEGGWNDVDRPAAQPRQQSAGTTGDRGTGGGWDSTTAGQVTRDSAARAEGAQRTSDASRARSSGSSGSSGGGARTGSYRPSGGGMRGGGGRRR
jgi:hypothetical protein